MQEITISSAAAHALYVLCYDYLRQRGTIPGITTDAVIEAGIAISTASRIVIAKEGQA
jgi:hypothetical protein